MSKKINAIWAIIKYNKWLPKVIDGVHVKYIRWVKTQECVHMDTKMEALLKRGLK